MKWKFPEFARDKAGPARLLGLVAFLSALLLPLLASAQEAKEAAPHRGGEAALVLPDFTKVTFFGGISGQNLLMLGLIVCALGLVFGLVIYQQLKNLPVHKSMRDISELIYETCKTYLA